MTSRIEPSTGDGRFLVISSKTRRHSFKTGMDGAGFGDGTDCSGTRIRQ
jgi:hypothetical protein